MPMENACHFPGICLLCQMWHIERYHWWKKKNDDYKTQITIKKLIYFKVGYAIIL